MPPKSETCSDRTNVLVWATERLGVATAVVMAVLIGLYMLGRTLISEVGIPLTRAHASFLASQVDAMTKIVECQERQQSFWSAVEATHRQQMDLLQQNQQILTDASTMMEGVPEERARQTAILQEIATILKSKDYQEPTP